MDDLFENVTFLVSATITILILMISGVFTLRRVMWKRKDNVNADEQKKESDEVKAASESSSTAPEKEKEKQVGGVNLDEIDPLEYCEHIQGEVKKAKQRVTTKKLAEKLSEEQLNEERELQNRQLEAIFKLMQTQQEKFGVNNIEEVQQQMKLYA